MTIKLTSYQEQQLERVSIGQTFVPWKIGMRITTVEALQKKGFFKLIKGRFSDIGLMGTSSFKRVK